MQPDVSVIIPVFNAQTYIDRCLESVCNQSHSNIEIIVIDDGSTDDTPLMLKKFITKDSRIKVVRKNNEGQGKARNEGIKIARGRYLTFVDADDWVDPNIYEVLLDSIEKELADVAVCNYRRVYTNGSIRNNKNVTNRIIEYPSIDFEKSIFDYFFGENIGSTVWNKLYKTEMVKGNNLSMGNTSIGEDFFFNLLTIVYSKKIVVSKEVLYNYFQPEESISRKYSRGITKKYMEYIPQFISRIKSNRKLDLYFITPLIMYKALSNGGYSGFCVDKKIFSIYKEVKEGMSIKCSDKVISKSLKNGYLKYFEPRKFRVSIKFLFILLSMRLYRLTSLYLWLRFKRIK